MHAVDGARGRDGRARGGEKEMIGGDIPSGLQANTNKEEGRARANAGQQHVLNRAALYIAYTYTTSMRALANGKGLSRGGVWGRGGGGGN